MSSRNSEMEGVIAYIHDHLDEPLPLSRLAKRAAYSPFHFTRIFKANTGLSPHQYVASLKVQKAKSLLVNTNLTIRDISMEIGQQSLGTFTTRFTEKVGISPMQFRKTPRQISNYMASLQERNNWSQQTKMKHSYNKVEGTIDADIALEGVILIGLFNKPIPEGLPQYGTLLSSLGYFCFTDVKPGIYYLMATAVFWNMQANEILVPNQTLRAKADAPIYVKAETAIPYQSLRLRGPRLDDPPILISLPLLMKNYLNRT
ncbi:AraC family transcriptional regulator [Gracilibacillus kekensis]|uniref:Transcriptional regulator, AraC family n=1 Tax=Gracilibacillus kekensis TaxID=1027249 RepID=A0A1M7PER1_9BACI|nr:AraC family transcriptional regulator [Gracilibacillus kekensis]SHN15475.1 transcriptional regulator, AraC family [Gracilibacillus kekensis]